MTPHFVGKILDVLVIVLWFSISVFFVRRYFTYQKLVSLMLAFMALGWATLGLRGFFPFLRAQTEWFNFVAIVLGCLIWYSVYRVSKTGR